MSPTLWILIVSRLWYPSHTTLFTRHRRVSHRVWASEKPFPRLVTFLPIAVMSQNLPETQSTSNYQVIFDNALKAYKNKTGNDLTSDPLLHKLESCNSPGAVLDLLREQISGFNQSGSSNDGVDGPMKWLNPTVNVLYAFSSTIGGAVSLVSLGKTGAIHIGLEI